MQMVIKSRMIYHIRLRSVLGKGSHLFGTRRAYGLHRFEPFDRGEVAGLLPVASDNFMKTNHYIFVMYCIDSTFALQSCVYTQASLVPLPHRVPP